MVLQDDVVVPANHEILISVPFHLEDDVVAMEPIVEDTRSLFIACSLINVRNYAIPVRLMNTGNEPIKLSRGYFCGELHPVVDIAVVDPQKISVDFLLRDVDVGCKSETLKTEHTLPEYLKSLMMDVKLLSKRLYVQSFLKC